MPFQNLLFAFGRKPPHTHPHRLVACTVQSRSSVNQHVRTISAESSEVGSFCKTLHLPYPVRAGLQQGMKRHVADGASGDPQTKKKKKKAGGLQDASSGSGVSISANGRRRPLPPHKYILAPMVGGSELAFRLLCRRYASRNLLCYTPMMSSERFATEPEYRKEAFQTTPEDRPLVAHFSGNDPKIMLAAARHVEGKCDAIDLNLGCPQRIAHSGHFGSFLLDDADRPLVLKIVKTLAEGLTTPVFVKIRLLATTEKTIELVTQLRDAGAALVAIHARHRVNLVGRSGPGARDGPALLDEVAKVVKAVKGVVIIANGNVKSFADVKANLASTGAAGIMSAEGMLDDPALFLPSAAEDGVLGSKQLTNNGGGDGELDADESIEERAAREARKVRKKLREIDRLEAMAAELEATGGALTAEEQDKVSKRKSLQKELKKINDEKQAAMEAELADPAAAAAAAAARAAKAESAAKAEAEAQARALAKPKPIELALEYVELARKHNVALRTVVFHTRRMAKDSLANMQLLAELLDAKDPKAVQAIVKECARREREGYKPDPERIKAERQALELKRWREQTRKRYEERMVRKAKREGKAEDHYLKAGSEVPTAEILSELKAMPKDTAWAQWKSRHGQHCWAMHMEEGGCTRERTCAFLHAEVKKNIDPEWHG